jgi:hypothetical protein
MARRGGYNMPGEPPPSNAFYGLVGTGMTAYVRTAFRYRVLGVENVRLEPGTLIVAAHRSDHDVPALCSVLYFEGGVWRGPPRMHFASRDDLFERGSLAGLAPGLPAPITRALWRFAPARGLARVRVHRLGGADLARPVQALRAVDPGTPVAEVLPADLVRRLKERAVARACEPPRTAGEALRPDFAAILFGAVTPADMDSPLLEDFWQARSREAATDMRRMVELVQAGEPLLLFPEGRVSPDGSIGPLRRGFGLLVRRARPLGVLPFALAYDRLTTGRPHLVLAAGPHFVPALRDEEADVLRSLRSLMPLTCGQVVATAVLGATSGGVGRLSAADLERRLEAEIHDARDSGRPVDGHLLDGARRRRLLAGALRALTRRGMARSLRPDLLELDLERARADDLLRRLAREFASAREAP